MTKKNIFSVIAILTLVLVVAGCSSTSDDDLTTSGDDNFMLSLADAPVNNIKEVNVTLKEVKVIREKNGEEIKETITDFNGGEKTFDLLNLRFDEALLEKKNLPEGKYKEIRLMIAAAEDAKGNGPGTGKSQIVFNDGSTTDFFVPSQKLQLKHDFIIEEGTVTRLLLDGDVSKIVKAAGKSGLILLEPTSINIIDKVISGNVSGRVFADVDSDGTFDEDGDGHPDEVLTNSDYDVTVEAYQNGSLVKSTVATIEDLDTNDDGTIDKQVGSYLLRGLKEGNYTIKAKVMKENSSSEMIKVLNSNDETLYQLQSPETVTIKAEEEVTVDLKLTKNVVQ